MTPLTIMLVGSGVFAATRWRGARRPGSWAVLSAAAVASPAIGILGGVSWAALVRRARLAEVRRHAERARAEEILLVHALLIALTGGLGLTASMLVAQGRLTSTLGDVVGDVIRRSRSMGLGPALQSTTGPSARLFRQLGAIHESGAPAVVALSSYAHELHELDRTRTLQRARQLPVKLLVPLTLLMLPGFLLLTIGPTVLSSFSRLLGPFGG